MLLPTNLGQPMHSPTPKELPSPNLAGIFLLQAVLAWNLRDEEQAYYNCIKVDVCSCQLSNYFCAYLLVFHCLVV